LLLIDEVDRADEPFEAFLLEFLGEYQVSIPELGPVQALVRPITILTSNCTRELNNAVKRRCLYLWIDPPSHERELAIVQAKVPDLGLALARQVAQFVAHLRQANESAHFSRVPGVAETVEWAKALVAMNAHQIGSTTVQDTAGLLFKQREDLPAESAKAAWPLWVGGAAVLVGVLGL